MSMRKDAISWLFSRIVSRRRRRIRRSGLRLESLEGRRLLAVTGDSPAITGTVYADANQDGSVTAGEELAGATIDLYLDNGDGVFDNNDTLYETTTTDEDGIYGFEDLDGLADYFVVQPEQVIGSVTLMEQVSGLLSPGASKLIIDQFETSQEATAMSPVPSSDGSTLQFADESEVIGAERDMFVEMNAGIGELRLRVNPFGMNPVLQYDSTSGVEGIATLTWDGIDNDPALAPAMGLGGIDLTEGGQNTGFTMKLGIDTAGEGDTITITLYQGSADNSSSASASIPLTDGTATGYLFMPFSSFTGPVSADNVDAIQANIGGNMASADAQVDFIGVTGPDVVNFSNDSGSDLAINKTDGVAEVIAGEGITYTITVENMGPFDVSGAVVEDFFPAELENVTYTSTTTGTVSGNTASGSGDINDTVDMTVGSSLTYTASATVVSSATGTLVNESRVVPPVGSPDPDSGNNISIETTPIRSEVDLIVTKSDNGAEVGPGDQFTYTITVANAGPSDVVAASLTDVFPAELTAATYTSSVVSGTVTGNTASGSDNINDLLNMTANSRVDYQVTVDIAPDATGNITNTVTIDPPEGTTERNPGDNTATETTPITPVADLTITKTNDEADFVAGEEVTYTIVARNLGPDDVTGAIVQDIFPAELENVTYVSTPTGIVHGNTASGSGDIHDTVDMTVGSSIEYTVTGLLVSSAAGELANTASITPPEGVVDPDPASNTSTVAKPVVREVDLVVTKDSDLASAGPGDLLNYQMSITNEGPSDVSVVQITDAFPAELGSISFTSTATGGATGNTASGTDDLNDTVSMPANSSVTYAAQGTVLASATMDIVNTITAETTAAINTNPDSSATVTTTLVPGVDLLVTKTNPPGDVSPGDEITYEIEVRNIGPNPANSALFEDTFSSLLENVNYTSTTSGGASGNTASGTGNINDSLNLPVDGSVTYQVTSTLRSDATGTLGNTATITAPSGTVNLNPSDSTSTVSNTIIESEAGISGFVFLDLNNDGKFDNNDPPVESAEVLLEKQDGTEIESQLTDENGAFDFSPLAAGSYLVQQIVPEGYRMGKDSDGGEFGELVEPGLFSVTLADGDVATDLYFGLLPLQPSKRELLASSFSNL